MSAAEKTIGNSPNKQEDNGMYRKNRYISVIFKLAIVTCGMIGILMQLSLFSGTAVNWGMFRFFTNLSNLACILYFLSAALWLIFRKEDDSTRFSPILWIIAPLVYFVYAVIAAQTGNVMQGGSRYPYPFIDIDQLGIFTVAVTVMALLAGFIVLGYVFYAIDHNFSKISQVCHERQRKL